MKISIVTPSYNQGRFIGRCLDSVRNQSGDFSVEHIILDNCSSDGTGALLAEYQANPGTVDVRIFVEPDEGQSAAINRGFGMATGDIVCWLNTDEYYMEGALAKVAGFFTEHPEADVVFGDCDFVDEAGVVVKRKREFFFSEPMLLYYGCYIPSCATFFRRTIITEGHLLDTGYRICMDFEYYLKLAQIGKRFEHFPQTLSRYTRHESNISTTFGKRRKWERRDIQKKYGAELQHERTGMLVFEFMRWFFIVKRNCLRIIRKTYSLIGR